MVAGVEKYFQIARCFRDEDLRADRQPEFTQIDLEMAFVDREEIFALMEELVQVLFKELAGFEPDRPFPRLSYHEAVRRFGTDKPDTRFGMELTDFSDQVQEAEFSVFRQVVAGGGSVIGITAPGCGNYSAVNWMSFPGWRRISAPRLVSPGLDQRRIKSPVAGFFTPGSWTPSVNGRRPGTT